MIQTVTESNTQLSNLHVLENQAQFNQLINTHDFVVVLFTAEWCQPCQTFFPVMALLAEQVSTVRVATVDIDIATDLVIHFGVTQVPALMVIRDRVIIDQVTGAMQAQELRHHLYMWQSFDMSVINAHFREKQSSS